MSPDQEHLLVQARAAQDALQAGQEEMRRVVQDLRPPVLDKLGLVEALREQSDRFRTTHQVQVDLEDRKYHEARLQSADEMSVYRIVQEALTNIAKHAQAHRVLIRVSTDSESLLVEIQDDGVGFDAGPTWWTAVHGKHFGLLGMRERARGLGAKLTVDSRPGAGTRVLLAIPQTQRETTNDER